MRTTITIDEVLVKKAAELTGVHDTTELVRRGLEALIAHECGNRLIRLGGTDKRMRLPPLYRSGEEANSERKKET